MKICLFTRAFYMQLLFLIFSFNVFAFDTEIINTKNHNVTGVILDAHSKQPLEYAIVALYRLRDDQLVGGSITDPKGVHTIENVDEGVFYLQINFIGFKKLKTGIFTIENTERKYDHLRCISSL